MPSESQQKYHDYNYHHPVIFLINSVKWINAWLVECFWNQTGKSKKVRFFKEGVKPIIHDYFKNLINIWWKGKWSIVWPSNLEYFLCIVTSF